MNHSADNFTQHPPDRSETRRHVVFLSGPGGGSPTGPGIITKILVVITGIAILALAASFAVVIAAIFAGLLLLLLAVAGLRHFWRKLTGQSSPDGIRTDFSDSGVHFSGRIVVTSSGPSIRTSTAPAKTVIDVPTNAGRIAPESTTQPQQN